MAKYKINEYGKTVKIGAKKKNLFQKIIGSINEFIVLIAPLGFIKLFTSLGNLKKSKKGFAGFIEIWTAFLLPLRWDIFIKNVKYLWTKA